MTPNTLPVLVLNVLAWNLICTNIVFRTLKSAPFPCFLSSFAPVGRGSLNAGASTKWHSCYFLSFLVRLAKLVWIRFSVRRGVYTPPKLLKMPKRMLPSVIQSPGCFPLGVKRNLESEPASCGGDDISLNVIVHGEGDVNGWEERGNQG